MNTMGEAGEADNLNDSIAIFNAHHFKVMEACDSANTKQPMSRSARRKKEHLKSGTRGVFHLKAKTI